MPSTAVVAPEETLPTVNHERRHTILKAAFDKMDVNGNGEIDITELKELAKSMG
jgi:Ca2+-binding EF-hand superfamily protein